MKEFQCRYCSLLRVARFTGAATAILFGVTAQNGAHAQAYTYDPPTCGAIYREESAKPRTLRVSWEINAGNQCANQNKFQIACQHFQNALKAADRMEPEAGSGDDIKFYIKSQMQAFGCQ